MRVKVENLLPGMALDLEYADPDHDHVHFQHMLADVAFAARETPDCILVGIEDVDWFGFPPGHKVKVKRFDRAVYAELKTAVESGIGQLGWRPPTKKSASARRQQQRPQLRRETLTSSLVRERHDNEGSSQAVRSRQWPPACW
jgi:hypothetical protein